ncbi:MAG: hypothetical protein JWP25_6616 [Bradyrhizobium sp.]|jgi:hypothetical protein|nr:hypothetical protein [Bradyrhizobium sp.]MEA2867850.1 hypothetical protein [Bradyrhizobium sp.]
MSARPGFGHAVHSPTTVTRTNSSPGRARNKPLKPLRAGMPGEPVRPWRLPRVLYLPPHTRLRVQRAPGIPHALCFLRARISCTTRAHRAARSRSRMLLKIESGICAGAVGWAKRLVRPSSKSEGGSVPTIQRENFDGRHGANAPLPTLRLPEAASGKSVTLATPRPHHSPLRRCPSRCVPASPPAPKYSRRKTAPE